MLQNEKEHVKGKQNKAQNKKIVKSRTTVFCFLTKGYQQQQNPNNSRNANNSMNIKNSRDVNNRKDATTRETPRTKGISTTVVPHQQQKRQQ
jgi:hypothetical protein